MLALNKFIHSVCSLRKRFMFQVSHLGDLLQFTLNLTYFSLVDRTKNRRRTAPFTENRTTSEGYHFSQQERNSGSDTIAVTTSNTITTVTTATTITSNNNNSTTKAAIAEEEDYDVLLFVAGVYLMCLCLMSLLFVWCTRGLKIFAVCKHQPPPPPPCNRQQQQQQRLRWRC